jgi:hypothetical protein
MHLIVRKEKPVWLGVQRNAITPIDQFNAALRHAGILKNGFGEKYSLYSLRHFYAVMALRNGVECSKSPETWGLRSR